MCKRKSIGAEQGVYEFRRLSLMGFDNTDPEIKKLQGLGYKVRAFFNHFISQIFNRPFNEI